MFRENQRIAAGFTSESLSGPFFVLVLTSGVRAGGCASSGQQQQTSDTYILYPAVREQKFVFTK